VPLVAVFDTNILFSAIGWRGNPYRCLELAREGTVEGITCLELLAELTARLASKLRFRPDQTADTVNDLLAFLRIVPIAGQLKAIPNDPDDEKVLECAISANADYVVTGDRRHLLPLGSFSGIRIVTASEFCAIVARS
jgi:putative PIN family toxin of toxin-antitoxin system